MNGNMHTDLTLKIALAVLKDPALAAEVSAGAAIPDYIDDIVVEGVGTQIVGQRLCRLTHFCVPYSKEIGMRPIVIRGYCWNMDSSVPSIDLPNERVFVNVHGWAEQLGLTAMETRKHPLYNVTGYADEMIYPSAYAMACWLWGLELLGRRPRVVGALLHFVQDCCVAHHVRGWLLRGHTVNEAELSERWFGKNYVNYQKRIVAGAAKLRTKRTPGDAIQVRLLETYEGPRSLALDSTIMRAVRASAEVLRMWRNCR